MRLAPEITLRPLPLGAAAPVVSAGDRHQTGSDEDNDQRHAASDAQGDDEGSARDDQETVDPVSEVLCDGRPLGARVSGSCLEAAVECGPGWLLFSTGDSPYEEMLRISLIARSGTLLDAVRIGGPYTTGAFSALRLDPPSRVHFRFIDDADWSVEILDAPRPSVPWWPDAKGVWRASRLFRHFRVHR